MNIVFIVIDTLRHDYVGHNGNPNIQTPNLDRLARQSWNFHRAFAGSYPTIPLRTDLMTRRYGAPFHPWKPLDCDKPTIPTALAELGYCTQLIHDLPHLVNGGHAFDYPFHAWTPIRGAEVDRAWLTDGWEFLDNWRFDPLFDGYPGDPSRLLHEVNLMAGYVQTNRGRKTEADWNAARLFSTAARFLHDNTRRDNFFLWIDCFDPHEPWDAPPEYMKMYDSTPGYDGSIDPRCFGSWGARGGLPKECWPRVAAQYAAKVTFMDRWLGVFLDALEETHLDRNTAVVVLGDHGTNQPGDRTGHPFGKTWPPKLAEAHVPFMVHVPNGGSGESDLLVQPQDVFATILGIAGGQAPDSVESYDVLKAAQDGTGPRNLALCGASISRWAPEKSEKVLFSVFDKEWWLGFAANPTDCELRKLTHPREDVAGNYPEVVQRLHREGLAEIARRGLDPGVLQWLQGEGKEEFPSIYRETDAHPTPPGWKHYYQNLYHGE